MKRNITEKLNELISTGSKKPIVLIGPKGIGKTYTMLECVRNTKKEILYLDFETDGEACEYFNEYYEGIKEVLDSSVSEEDTVPIIDMALASYFEINESLISDFAYVLDELGFCRGAEALLSHGTALSVYSTASTSIIHSEALCCVRMYPMTFDEFLLATNHEWYRDVITAHFENCRHVPDIIHNDLLDLFDMYLELGGMPGVIAEYLKNDRLLSIPSVQNSSLMLNTYLYERILDSGEALKVRQVINLVLSPLDLKKDYKFKYNQLRKGATYNIYSQALSELFSTGVVVPCYRTDIAEKDGECEFLPDRDSFRAYFYDSGLLKTAYNCRKTTSHTDDENSFIYLESCLMQHLKANERDAYYWESGAKARIDFVIRNQEGIIPVEIRTEEQKKQKSMNVFRNKVKVSYSIRLCSDNFELRDGVKHIPFYAMFCL